MGGRGKSRKVIDPWPLRARGETLGLNIIRGLIDRRKDKEKKKGGEAANE